MSLFDRLSHIDDVLRRLRAADDTGSPDDAWRHIHALTTAVEELVAVVHELAAAELAARSRDGDA